MIGKRSVSPIRHRRIVRQALSLLVVVVAVAMGSSAANAFIPKHTFVDVEPVVIASLDPAVLLSGISPGQISAFEGTLVRPKSSTATATVQPGLFALRPYLASSWKREADGSYTFSLRTDVKSNYGNPLTSADVVYTMKRMLAVSSTVRFLVSIANIDPNNPATAVGPHKVRINAIHSGSMILGVMATFYLGIYDSVELGNHATTADPWASTWLTTHSASYSPYYVAAFVPSQTIFLKANPNFPVKPFFKAAVIKSVPDSGTRLQLMLAGQADRTTALEWAQFGAAVKSGKLLARPAAQGRLDELELNEHYTPFADVRVRQAVSMAIDRVALVKSIYLGYAVPATHQYPASLLVSPPPPPMPGYDVAAAKALMAQAGYPNGFDVTLSATNATIGNYAPDEMAFIQSQLAQIGIKVTINVIALQSDFTAQRTKGALQAWLDINRPAVGDPSYALALATTTTGSGNRAFYSNAKVDQLVATLLVMNPGKRYNRVIHDIIKLTDAELPAVPLAEPNRQIVYSSRMKGEGIYGRPDGELHIDDLAAS